MKRILFHGHRYENKTLRLTPKYTHGGVYNILFVFSAPNGVVSLYLSCFGNLILYSGMGCSIFNECILFWKGWRGLYSSVRSPALYDTKNASCVSVCVILGLVEHIFSVRKEGGSLQQYCDTVWMSVSMSLLGLFNRCAIYTVSHMLVLWFRFQYTWYGPTWTVISCKIIKNVDEIGQRLSLQWSGNKKYTEKVSETGNVFDNITDKCLVSGYFWQFWILLPHLYIHLE